MQKLILTFILLAFLAPVLFAQDRVGDMAVMDITYTGKNLTKEQIGFLSDDIREKAVEITGYRIMNRENIFTILKDKKVDLSKCEGPECEVEYGRLLQADKLITSNIIFSGGTFFIKLKIYDVSSATMEKSVSRECKGCDFSGLRKSVQDAARDLLGKQVSIPKPSLEKIQASAESEVGKEILPQGTKGGPMVLIPAGEFMMGCNASMDYQCENNENPYHRIYLDNYYINKYEVTNAEYRNCVAAGGCKEPEGEDRYRNLSWDNHPVVGVSWFYAADYCKWAGKRLPTEAEWEKAARGTDGRVYPWGYENANCNYAVICQLTSNRSWNYGCDRKSTWPVGSKPNGASPYGVMDMAGNVGEWVNDWYGEDYYNNSPAQNPLGSRSGKNRVLRGGSWYSDPYALRTSSRQLNSEPERKSEDLGFRCVRDAK
jgi:formylglycine-generating enzyme required for sulfatase activity